MKKARHGTTRKRKPGVGRQRRGIAHFLAEAIPTLVVGGKDAAMGGLGAAAKLWDYESIKILREKEV